MGRRLRYYLREALVPLKRNPLVAFAAISTVFISLFLLGGSLLVERQIRLMAGEWAEKVEVSVYLRDEASQAEIQTLGEKIRSFPEVERVYFETREQAYERFKDLFRDSRSLVENVGADALPQSYRIKLVEPEKFAVIRARLAGEPAVERIRDERALLNNLFAATAVLRLGAMAVAVIMLLASSGLIANTVRMAVFARRREIGIMKLVGATNWFIRVPFLIEGLIQGLLGAATAVLGIFAMKVLFIDPNRGKVAFIRTWIDTPEILFVIPILLVVGVLVSTVASILATRRFLDV